MSEARIRSSREGRVAIVTLDRPEARNALDVAMLDRLPELLRELAQDEGVACIVLTGAGEAFCAGGDVRGLGDRAPAPAAGDPGASAGPPRAAEGVALRRLADRIDRWAQASVLLHEMPLPTLAAVNGTAAGAGMGLALACDLRIGCEHSRFITSFARIAMSGDFGGSHLLTQLVGTAKARELYFLSEPVSAEEALRLGLLNWQVPAAELAARSLAIAERLACLPAATQAAMKANLNASVGVRLRDVVRLEADAMARTSTSPEAAQAAAAFFASRRS